MLLGPALVGIFFFGAVRLWSIGPLMFLVYLGVALFFLRPFFSADLRQLQVPPGGIAWLFFFAYGLAAIPFAAVPYEARIEWLKVGSCLGAYWAWSELASRHKWWKILLGLLFFAVSLIAWYAIIQHAQGSRMVLMLERPECYGMRASGTYFCPNHFANLMEILIPIGIAIVLTGRAGIPLRLLAGYSVLLFLPVMLLTQSRSGWIGTVVGIGVTVLLLSMKKGKKWFFTTLALTAIGVVALAVALWSFSDIFRSRILEAMAGNVRLQLWRDTLMMIRASPIWGFGPGSWPWVYPEFRTINVHLFYNYAHNEYLQLTAEYGLVGLGLFAAVLITGCIKLLHAFIKVERDKDANLVAGFLGSLAACLAHGMFDFNFHIYANNHVLILVAGVVVGGLYASGQWKARPLKGISFVGVYGGAALLALGLAVATAQVFVSYGLHYLGDLRRDKFEMPEAGEYFQQGMKWDPGNWQPWLGMAHILQSQGFWNYDITIKSNLATEAIGYYQAALARNPYDLEAVFGLSKCYNTLGEQGKALDELSRAVRHDKYHLFYLSQLGLQLRRMERYPEALQVFEAMRKISPGNEMAKLNINLLQAKIAESQKPAGQNPAP